MPVLHMVERVVAVSLVRLLFISDIEWKNRLGFRSTRVAPMVDMG